MACAITATAGSATANSYATIAEGTTYHDAHISGTTWAEYDDDTRCRALQTATRLLDQWFEWDGEVTTETQALLWPRDGVWDVNGYELANNTIPERIRDAVCELARLLIAQDLTAEPDGRGVSSVTAGSVSVTFSGASTTNVIPESVWAFVAPYGRRKGLSGPVSLRRG